MTAPYTTWTMGVIGQGATTRNSFIFYGGAGGNHGGAKQNSHNIQFYNIWAAQNYNN